MINFSLGKNLRILAPTMTSNISRSITVKMHLQNWLQPSLQIHTPTCYGLVSFECSGTPQTDQTFVTTLLYFLLLWVVPIRLTDYLRSLLKVLTLKVGLWNKSLYFQQDLHFLAPFGAIWGPLCNKWYKIPVLLTAFVQAQDYCSKLLRFFLLHLPMPPVSSIIIS